MSKITKMGITTRRCVNNMQRLRNIISCFMLFGFLTLASCGNNDLCVGDEISRVLSPDKRVDAVVTKGNCGATTSYSYQVSVVQAGKAPVESDIIFLADKAESVSVSWQAPKKLVISYKEARIFKFTSFWSSKDLDNFQYIVSVVEVQRD